MALADTALEQRGPHHILIVDDEQIILDALSSCLEAEKFVTVGARSGEVALALLDQQPFDLTLLDVGLPGASGFDVCRAIRAHSDMPVIFLTAAHELPMRLNGFDLGADDYVTKPFALPEVVRRVRAVLRRREHHAATIRVLHGPSGLVLNRRTREVHADGLPVALKPQEFAVLAALLERRGEVLSADAIALAAWGHGTYGERNFVEAQISRIRATLTRAGADDVIRTIRGVGYVVRQADAWQRRRRPRPMQRSRPE